MEGGESALIRFVDMADRLPLRQNQCFSSNGVAASIVKMLKSDPKWIWRCGLCLRSANENRKGRRGNKGLAPIKKVLITECECRRHSLAITSNGFIARKS